MSVTNGEDQKDQELEKMKFPKIVDFWSRDFDDEKSHVFELRPHWPQGFSTLPWKISKIALKFDEITEIAKPNFKIQK